MSQRPRVVVLVLVVLVVGSVWTGVSPATAAAAETDDQIVRTMEFFLTPSDPGTVEVEMSYSIPDSVVALETTVPESSTVLETTGFSQNQTSTYTWDGETEEPTVRFEYSANRTGAYLYDVQMATGTASKEGWSEDGAGSPAAGSGEGLIYVDTGSWAIVPVPSVGVSWSYQGTPGPSFTRQATTDGPGVAGTNMVFLGAHEKQTRAIDDQQVTLVVPDAATLGPSEGTVLNSIANASTTLRTGEKPEEILFVAAPTGVEWGPNGIAKGEDAWVRADRPVTNPNNVWLHEYVHMLQDFRTTENARWTVEAMGEYYAALLTLEQGHIDFDAFAAHLEEGEDRRYDDVVLSNPDSWTEMANYVQGGLVFGNLDRRMRLATDGSESASHLLREMNQREKRVDHAFVRHTVGSLAGDDPASYIDTYASTDRSPSMWIWREHRDAFGTALPRIVSDTNATYTIAGPYRNQTVSAIPTLVPGENLTFTVTLTNEGETSGVYENALAVDGTQVSVANGTLDGGSSTTINHSHTVRTPGTHAFAIGSEEWNVTVAEPATPTIADVTVSRVQVQPGDSVTVNVTVANREERPAEGNVSVAVDGSRIDSWTERLAGGETSMRTVSVTLEEPGAHEITVGNRTVTVNVIEPTTSETTTSTTTTSNAATPGTTAGTGTTQTETTIPGFGIPVAIVGAVLGLALWAGRTTAE